MLLLYSIVLKRGWLGRTEIDEMVRGITNTSYHANFTLLPMTTLITLNNLPLVACQNHTKATHMVHNLKLEMICQKILHQETQTLIRLVPA